MDKQEIKELAAALLDEMESRYGADLAPRWEGGSIFFIPRHSELKEHEMPLDRLMHKIVMVRDNLRVLEQQINSSENLSEGEKVKLQGYITRCYGSMTSFNFLFADDEDKFSARE